MKVKVKVKLIVQDVPGHMVVFIAKSRIQNAVIAMTIAVTRCASESGSNRSEARCGAYEKVKIPNTVATIPPIINGRRRPSL